MEKKNKNMKLVLLLTLLGAVGIIAIIPYQMTLLMNNELYQFHDVVSLSLIIGWGVIQQTFILFVLVLIGVNLQRRTQLSVPILDAWVNKKPIPSISKKWIMRGIIGAFIGSVLLLLMDHLVFVPLIDMPTGEVPTTTWWQGLLAMLYGGITEELMIRLFIMTLIVWVLAKVSKKEKENIPKWHYYTGIILASLLFGIGHLPATERVFEGLTAVLIIRGLLINGVLGLWFGYLYWKKGLEYAIISHMSADFFIHVVFNAIFN